MDGCEALDDLDRRLLHRPAEEVGPVEHADHC
jgi:hypothetical protein